MSDRASKALAEAPVRGEPRTYDARSRCSGVPLSTLYYRDHGRRSKEEKDQGQQYLTPSEEKALETYLKQMADLGNPVRIKYLPSLAFSIARRRSTTNKATKPPNKNWAQAFQKRHPALKAAVEEEPEPEPEPDLELEPEPEMAQTSEASVQWRAPVARMY